MLLLALLIASLDGGASSPIQPEPRPGPAGEVTAVVIDERGAPIAGAVVELMGGDHHDLRHLQGETGADGRVTVTGVATSMYGTTISVHREGYGPVRGTLEETSLRRGALSVRIRLGKAQALAGIILAPDATSGSLRLIQAPPPGADPARWRYTAVAQATGTLGPGGGFAFEVPEGDYELSWLRPSGAEFFAVVHAPSAKLALQAPVRALDGRVLASTGAPLAGASVEVERALTQQPSWPPGLRPSPLAALTKTDAQGRFSVKGLDIGPYRVEASSGGLCHARAVELREAGAAAELTFGSGWTLTGQVVDGEGHGLPGTAVILTEPPDQPLSMCSARSAVTDAQGRFTLRDIDLDAARVATVPARGSDLPTAEAAVRKGAPPLTLTVRQLATRTVRGVVLGPDRKPIAGAMVSNRGAFTDERGQFSVVLGPADPPVVSVSRRCFVQREVPEAEAATIVLERRPCLAAYVVDAQKRPVPGLHSLEVKRADGTRLASCTTRQAEADCTLEAELGELVVSGTLRDGRAVRAQVKVDGPEKRDVYLTAP